MYDVLFFFYFFPRGNGKLLLCALEEAIFCSAFIGNVTTDELGRSSTDFLSPLTKIFKKGRYLTDVCTHAPELRST